MRDAGTIKKPVLAERVLGTLKWFNVKNDFGIINCNDMLEDIFSHQTAIMQNNPQNIMHSIGEGDTVGFDVVIGGKGREAGKVTGLDGKAVPHTLQTGDVSEGSGSPDEANADHCPTRAAEDHRTATTSATSCSFPTRYDHNHRCNGGSSKKDLPPLLLPLSQGSNPELASRLGC